MTETQNTKPQSGNEKQARYLSQAIQLEESANPRIIKATMSLISMAILVFLVWAGFTNVNEIARTPGEVVPYGYQQTIQHLEGGMVAKIMIYEGEVVTPDQILVKLNDAAIRKDYERSMIKQQALEMQAERLRAFIEDREPNFSEFQNASAKLLHDQMAFYKGMRHAREQETAVIQGQLNEKEQNLQTFHTDLQTAKDNLVIANDVYKRRIDLNRKGYASDMQMLEDKKRVNDIKGDVSRLENQILMAQSIIEEYKNRLSSVSARHRDEVYEKLADTNTEISQNIEIIRKLEERLDRMDIRSPTHGLIKGLAINTIGAVIQPGQVIMEIVPLDKQLEVQVRISPQDIGHITTGQPVAVKFSTFDFSRYGSVEGRLEQISATTFSGDKGERYYQGRVVLNKNYVGNNPDNVIAPGMTAMADIITGKKTILQYMLKPIQVSMLTAFTER